MTTSAIQRLLSAILLGAMLAASAPAAADQVTDSSIRSWVNEALRHDPLVPASEVSVGPKKGVVTPSGRVDNLAGTNRVDRQASRIRGVREVLNELTVAPSPLWGADIVYGVRRRILDNATIVSQGLVVTRVDFNGTRVKPTTVTISKRSDARLAKEIRNGFRRHWTTSRVADRIRVSVKDGIATLTGDLDTWGERFEAARVAFGIEGVWRVLDRLTVQGYDYKWEKWEYEAPYYYEELFPGVA